MVGYMELLWLNDCLREVLLTEDADQHVWRLDATGVFSAKSAYRAFFNGSVTFKPWRHLWKYWAPGKCKFFLWLAIKNRCWTAYRLARRGMSHPEQCPLCDQKGKTIQHLLVCCVFSRQVWFTILSSLGLDRLVPRRRQQSFAEWWSKASHKVKKEDKKGQLLNHLDGLAAVETS